MQYKTIPPELYDEFTLNGQIPVINNYCDQSAASNPQNWETSVIDATLQKARVKQPLCYSEDEFLYLALEKYRAHIANKDVLVVGSEQPGYECILLSYDANPFTIDFRPIICHDPRIKTLTAKEFEMNPRTFDAFLSVSSIEHDGLGRYGDPINPRGDLLFMERAKTLIKKDGLFFLHVPIGKDYLVFNLHRVYGKLRLPLLLKGWRLIDTFGYTDEMLEREPTDYRQPCLVLTPE